MNIKTILISIISILLVVGCSIPDEETLEAEKDACIDSNNEINKTRISESCFRDPQFTDCSLTEGDQVIGSDCTLKYEGKGLYESKQICIDSIADSMHAFETLRAIIRGCQRDNSEGSLKMRIVFGYIGNFILVILASLTAWAIYDEMS